MATKKEKLSHCDARKLLVKQGIDFTKDFYELRSSDVDLVVDAAKAAGYRKRRDAPGSRGRMYFQLLQRSCKR